MEKKTPRSNASLRRQQQIEKCLYENMLTRPYRSISVSDLCQQVGISRKAYYNYYRDKDACLGAIIDYVLRDSMLHLTTTMSDNATSMEGACILLDYWKSHKELLDMLVRNDLLHLLMLRNMEYLQHEETAALALLDTSELKSDTDILACYMSCQLTLVLQWYYRGFDTPTEEMARKLLRIVHRPLITVKEE